MALTVSPNYIEGPEGEVLTDFSVNHRQPFHHGAVDQPEDYFEDEFGQTHHKFGSLDPERVQRIEQMAEFDELPDSPRFDPEDTEALMELAGGQPQYAQILQWAASTLPEETTAEYDRIMESGDLAAMEGAIIWLVEQFHQIGGEFVSDDESSDLQQAVYEAYPNYREMVEWARDNLNADMIHEYDSVMESGDRDVIPQYIDQLARIYNEVHYDGSYA